MWLCAAAGTVIWLPVLAVAVVVDPGELGWIALGLMIGSGTLHTLYFTLLQRGYGTGDLSLVYPLARGTGPLLAGAAAIVFLGERPSALALAGGLIIVGAVFALAGRHGSREAVLFALLTGVAIASYTLWDKHSVGPSELSPVVYYWGTNLTVMLVLTPVVLRAGELPRGELRRATAVGVLSPLAYVLVLFALARAPVSVVAPARETSILIGTLLGTTVLGEGEGRRRVVAACAVVLGVTALALG